MKNDDSLAIIQAIPQLLTGPLSDTAALHLAEPAETGNEMPHGFHCHDSWELFCPLQGSLQFVTLGCPPTTIPNRHLLMVPPHCLHFTIDLLPQPQDLTLLVMNLPGELTPYGGLRISSTHQMRHTTLSQTERAAWATCAGTAPGIIMEQVFQALSVGIWGRERALGMLRILLAAFAEVTTHPLDDRLSLDARRVAEAQLYLQSHYYESTLSVETVATALNLSASHLGALFRKITGQTLYQTLIELRLRRATDLLSRTAFSIKEIATLTGWSNQLYFSAAYHRHYGQSPSAVRLAAKP